MKKRLLKAVVLLGILTLATQAYAVVITPGSGGLDTNRWEGNENSQNLINDAILSYLGDAEKLYKAEVGGGEEGPLASSYDTTFLNDPLDPADALITYVGGDIVGPTAFLLVKDGKQTPAWYLFNLTSIFGWNGTDDLELSGFWPNHGAISHVTLYGTPVPEPGTLLLLGSGLVGLASWGRKKFRR